MIRKGGDWGNLKGRTLASAERGSSAQTQPKLPLYCQIFQFWKEAGGLNFCGKSLEFEILFTNLNISKYRWPIAYLVGVSLGR